MEAREKREGSIDLSGIEDDYDYDDDGDGDGPEGELEWEYDYDYIDSDEDGMESDFSGSQESSGSSYMPSLTGSMMEIDN